MRQGPSHARNEGVRIAEGDLLLFCDADDVVSHGWVASMVRAAGDADLVAGRLDVERLNGSLCRGWHDTPPVDRPLRGHDFLPFASGGNCAIWRDVFESLGGFDERRVAGEDVDLSWRAQLAAHRLGFAPDGVVHQRLKSDLRELASQHFGWGRAYVELFRDFHSAGMPRTSLLGAAVAWGRIIFLGPFLALSRHQRGRWIRQAAERSGKLAESITQRVLFL
jgi:GT2 family glycosyltransferase